MEMVEIDDGLKLSLSLKSYETRESQTSPPATLQLSLGRSSPSSFDFGQHQGRQISLFKDWIIFAAGQRNPSIVEKTSKISPHSSSAMIDAGPSSALPPSPTVIELDDHDHKRVSSPNSTSSSVKGAVDREAISTDEEDGNAGGGNGGGGGGGGGVERKKLRLTKEQSVVLENTFREQTTLNTKQKVTLAKKLNLRPRQVEVWFQNRRARTKLKQTEVDCEYLKRCCESLTDENRRLQKELSELKTLKLSPEHYTNKNPPTTLSLCPSCARSTASPNFASSSSSHLSAVAQSSVPTANWYRGHAKVAVPVNNSELLRM